MHVHPEGLKPLGLNSLEQMSFQCPLNALGVYVGVYGNWDGDWVDEESECRSESARGLIRAAHEAKWAAAAAQQKLPLHIFRLGGMC